MGRASRQKKDREEKPTAPARTRPAASRVTLSGAAAAPWWHVLAALTLAALAFLIYWPALPGQFVFDDHNAILESWLVRAIWPLHRFIQFSNRPLVDFTYAINYAQGEYDSWWYHATNVAIHAATAVVLYFLALRTLRLPQFAERYAPWSQPIAWAAAAIFVSHPLASETVAYVASRSEGLAGFFYLLSILGYAVALSGEQQRVRRLARIGLVVTTFCAVASKEISATIPLALVLYDYLFISRCDWRDTWRRAALVAPTLLPLVLGGAYVLFRLFLSGQHVTPYQQSAGFGLDLFTPLEYASTQAGVLAYYLRLLVLPTGLTMDHDWPLARNPLALDVVLPLLLLVALAVAAVRARRTLPFFSFAVLFFFLVLAPTSSIMPLADLAVERRMYIPLAGFAVLAVTAVADLARRVAGRRGLAAMAVSVACVVAIFSTITRARATLWGDHLLLYQDAAAKAPGSPRVRLNLGVVHLNAGRYEEAHEVLFEAKRIFDEGTSIHAFPRIGAFIYYNLGAIQFIRQEYEESLQYMRKAIEIGGHYVALRPRAYAVIGEIYKLDENFAAAETALEEALKYNRDHPEWMLSLAEAQLMQTEAKAAVETLERLRAAHPEMEGVEHYVELNERAYLALAATYLYEDEVHLARRTLRLLKNRNPEAAKSETYQELLWDVRREARAQRREKGAAPSAPE